MLVGTILGSKVRLSFFHGLTLMSRIWQLAGSYLELCMLSRLYAGHFMANIAVTLHSYWLG